MQNSQKRAIIQILFLYLGTTAIFLAVLFYSLYIKETRYLIDKQFHNLREMGAELYEILHASDYDVNIAYKQLQEEFRTPIMIFDRNGRLLYDTINIELTNKEYKEGFAKRGDKVIIEPQHRFRKGRYKIFFLDDALDSAIMLVKLKVSVYFVIALVLAGIIAYFLVRLSLKPLQEKIDSLNAFIKDSTHEINTPLSIILMSIETLISNNLTKAQKQKIQRIKLASKSLSHLYKDLVAYNFPHSINNKRTNLALDELLNERLEYFAPFFEQKSLHLKTHIKPSTILASDEKMACVIDNLLNNAIKYNKKGGEIRIELRPHYLSIADSGCGIKSTEIARIFERYVRCNSFQGGFGIGLTLIKRICDEYGITIEVKSEVDKGSEFILIWQG